VEKEIKSFSTVLDKNMSHLIKRLLVGIFIFSLIVLIIYGIFDYLSYPRGFIVSEGIIRYIDHNSGLWRLEVDKRFLWITVSKAHFGIENLPTEFQNDGLKVRATYHITDVIGTSDWDTFIRITKIERTK